MATVASPRLSSRLAQIAHGAHPVGGPVSAATIETIVTLLDIEHGAAVLDLGCGGAEWLIVLVDRNGCNGEGVDQDELMLGEAKRQAQYRLVDPEQLLLRQADVRDFKASQPYDAVLCTGATGAFGGLTPALTAIKALLRRGGRALVSELFWQQPPTEAALQSVAGGAGLLDLAGTFAATFAAGFVPLYWHVSSQSEWDDYESMRSGSIERFAIDNPRDADAPALLDIARHQRDAYLTGYRGSLGCVTCILAKPNA